MPRLVDTLPFPISRPLGRLLYANQRNQFDRVLNHSWDLLENVLLYSSAIALAAIDGSIENERERNKVRRSMSSRDVVLGERLDVINSALTATAERNPHPIVDQLLACFATRSSG